MSLQIPRSKITKEEWEKFLKDPEVLTLECLFIFLTLTNIFILYRILLDICPFPIAVTWFQLLVGLLLSFILGAVSTEFPRCAFFPPFSIQWSLYQNLAIPIVVYLGMITVANVLLNNIPSVAAFPVAVSLAVFLHHISRFLGCGQVYLPIRWIALIIMLIGFLMGVFDSTTIGISVFPIALFYGLFSAIFRAWCLERAMHVVEGRGNTLHNHQVVLGLILLPIAIVLRGEHQLFSWMPTDFGALFTWQCWGVLVASGILPFLKNIVANRMIRRTGQAPWRILEVISMVLVFVIGVGVWDTMSIVGALSFVLVFIGRGLGMLDALSKDPNERRRAIRQEGQHGSSLPTGDFSSRYDPIGVAETFERSMEEECVVYESTAQLIEEKLDRDIEMSHNRSTSGTKALKYYAAKSSLLTSIAEEVKLLYNENIIEAILGRKNSSMPQSYNLREYFDVV